MLSIKQVLAADQRTGMVCNGREWTRDELSAAMDAVKNPKGWKLPIDAVIDRDAMNVTADAIVFFAGCQATFTEHFRAGFVRVQAIGYYAAVGS